MTSAKASFDLVGLFDFLEDVLAWVKDRDGSYLWVNRAFLLNYALANCEWGHSEIGTGLPHG